MFILTGGAGFIGSCLLAELNSQGISDILIVDNITPEDASLNYPKAKNLEGKKYRDYVHKSEFLRLLNDNADLGRIQGIFHLGACSSTTETNVEYMLSNNFEYSKTLVSWALSNNIRTIYASSAATYGDGAEGFKDDEALIPGLKALNIYGHSKQLFDLWCLETGASNRVCGLKFFNVFGPNEYHKGNMSSLIFKAVKQIRERSFVSLFKSEHPDYADGEQMRDFVYVKDCTRLMLGLMERTDINGIFNLGSAQASSWNTLIRAVFSAMGKPFNVQYVELPREIAANYQYYTEADMSKLKAVLPQAHRLTPLTEAVCDYVQNYLDPDLRYY